MSLDGCSQLVPVVEETWERKNSLKIFQIDQIDINRSFVLVCLVLLYDYIYILFSVFAYFGEHVFKCDF